MLCYLFLWNILFIPFIHSNNITVVRPNLTNKTTQLTETSKDKVPIGTKIPVLSEGMILPETPVLSLPKDKHNILETLDNEMGKNKEKPVMPRKGVVYSPPEDAKSEEKIMQSDVSAINITDQTKSTGHKQKLNENNVTSIHVDNSTIRPIIHKITSDLKNKTTLEAKNKTEMHKPTKLSYDELAHVVLKSSPQTVNNQLPSPNRESKVAITANTHPGMVMPVVITILLVPMFAVLGYMALRKGQDAWKNRHYKRVDFLLDGMYND